MLVVVFQICASRFGQAKSSIPLLTRLFLVFLRILSAFACCCHTVYSHLAHLYISRVKTILVFCW